MRVFLPKMMRNLLIWSGLLFAGLQGMAAQAGSEAPADKFLQPVYKTIDGKTVTNAGRIRPVTPDRMQAVAQQEDDLQAYLDRLAATSANRLKASTVVDLSQFQGTDRTRPLYVRNAGNYSFINGTLSRNTALQDSAVLVIQQGAVVEWGSGAVLSGGNFASGHELVLVEKGTFTVSSGTIKDAYCESTKTFDDGVVLKTGTSFTMTGGLLYNTGGIVNRYKSSVSILGGQIAGGGILATSDFILSGSADISMVYVSLYDGAKTLIRSGLQKSVDCVIPDSKEGLVVATGTNNYLLTQSDLGKFIYSDPQSKQTKEWEYALTGGNIVLKEKSNLNNEDDLQRYLDKHTGEGSADHPVIVDIPEKGIIISKPLTTPRGYWRFTGGTLTFSGGWIVTGGYSHCWFVDIRIIWTSGGSKPESWIRVNGGGTVNIGPEVNIGPMICKYGIYIEEGGIVNMYGGTLSGCEWGIYNVQGIFNFYGGTITGNTIGGIYNGTGATFKYQGGNVYKNTRYDIFSRTCFWLSGSANVGTIYLGKGACIYATSGLKYKWQIYFIDEFEINKTIVIGDGYTLGQGDIAFITIYIPDGFSWYWDQKCSCIQIQEKGTGGINSQEKLQKAINEATGTCNGNPTVIEISGTIEIDSLLIDNKSVKLTGGTLILNHAAARKNGPFFFRIQGGCLTLENIVLDGNKSRRLSDYPSSPIRLYGTSSLTINRSTVIKNTYVYDGHNGLIYEGPNATATVTMNGGAIMDNEIPASAIFMGLSSAFIMNGGEIYRNKVYEIFYTDRFVLNGGAIQNNPTDKITLTTGVIGSNSQFVGEGTTLWVESNVELAGDARLNGHLNVTLGKPGSVIAVTKALKSELTINHASSATIPKPQAGTIVATGSHYTLTESDLAKFSYKDYKFSFALDKAKNVIVLQEVANDAIRTGDDLQDYLDKLAKEEKMGTEQEPQKIDKFVNPVKFDKSVEIPNGMVVKFLGGALVSHCSNCGTMMHVPQRTILILSGTTLTGNTSSGRGGLTAIGKVIVNENALVDYVNGRPGCVWVLDGGTMGTSGKATVCGEFEEGSEPYMKKGKILSDIVTSSPINWSGAVKLDGCIYFKNPGVCKLKINSALQSSVKVGYKFDGTVAPGTVVASGTDAYSLTKQDLNYLVSADSRYSFELKNGNIVVSYATANDEITPAKINAVVSDGLVVLSGLTPGEEYAVYAMDGHLVCKEKAEASTVSFPIRTKGIYLIRYLKTTLKVVCTN